MKKLTALFVTLLLTVFLIVLPACNSNNYTTDDTPVKDSTSESTANSNDTIPEEETTEHTHQWLEATCTFPKTCRLCGKTKGEHLGHNWIEATCTTAKTCKNCKETEGDVLGHIDVIDNAIASTCTTNGLTEGKHCGVCNEIIIKQSEIVAIGHIWQSATCTISKTCSICNETEGAPLGHIEVIDNAVEPTITSTGLTEGSHCSVCNAVLIEQVIIPQKDSPSEISSFQIEKNDILRTYASLYDYNEYSIDYVDIDKKDMSDSEFQITITIGAVMLLIPEYVDYVPDYIKGYWELVKDGETIDWDIFTISNVEELEYGEASFTCRNLEAGEYTLRFTSYI